MQDILIRIRHHPVVKGAIALIFITAGLTIPSYPFSHINLVTTVLVLALWGIIVFYSSTVTKLHLVNIIVSFGYTCFLLLFIHSVGNPLAVIGMITSSELMVEAL